MWEPWEEVDCFSLAPEDKVLHSNCIMCTRHTLDVQLVSCRYAVYGEEITAVGSSEDSLRGLAEWLSLCMSGSSGLPYETGTPEALVDDDAPEWLGAAMQWAKHVLG